MKRAFTMQLLCAAAQTANAPLCGARQGSAQSEINQTKKQTPVDGASDKTVGA